MKASKGALPGISVCPANDWSRRSAFALHIAVKHAPKSTNHVACQANIAHRLHAARRRTARGRHQGSGPFQCFRQHQWLVGGRSLGGLTVEHVTGHLIGQFLLQLAFLLADEGQKGLGGADDIDNP